MARGIEIKKPAQVELMRAAGLVVARIHAETAAALRPGVTPQELDEIARAVLKDAGATSNFLGYHGFPATICVSVNDQVVHTIPSEVPLAEGDVVSVDAGAIVEGWHADAAYTAIVGAGTLADRELVEATREAMWAGITAATSARNVGEISRAIEEVAGNRYGIPVEYTGHGIGTAMHQAPDVPNAYLGRIARVKPGMCLAIEPIFTGGGAATRELNDGWTVLTEDGSRAAHWEHTVAVLPEEVWVLTSTAGERLPRP